jgi:hypothetical protein
VLPTPVAVHQRIDQAAYKLLIDERVLADTDTLMVFGLDISCPSKKPNRGESTPSGSGSGGKALACCLRRWRVPREALIDLAKE